MKRREFLASLGLLPLLPTLAHAAGDTLSIGIFPGTGTADMIREELRSANRSFSQVVASAAGRPPALTIFTALKSINRSIESGRMDLYFAPPTVAVTALDHGYVPINRVKGDITVMLVKRKGASVTSVALTEKESLPDVMGRYVLKEKKEPVKVFNLRAQEDVVLAMERNFAQAGGLGPKMAKALIAKGTYEPWHPLPSSPSFTLVATKSLSTTDVARIQTAVNGVSPAVLAEMQKVFAAKLAGFVNDDGAQLRVLREAMKSAGYA